VADAGNCVKREPATGTNISTRVKCTVESEADRERSRQQAEQMREDQNRRKLPRPQ
jgi:hypothetical protein